MDSRVSIDSEALLEEAGWVRALARRLVPDAGKAEDVAQDALVVALKGARHEPRSLRRWLGAVVRNLSRNALRRESRRARVEAPLQEEPALPSTLELLERAATQRALVGALLELKEPDRSVLLLRYFQEHSNEEIARLWGVPASTVATRLARAHARLRAKWLAQNGGDRRAGLAALAALARGRVENSPAKVATTAATSSAGWCLPRFFGALQAAGLASVLVGSTWWLHSAAKQESDALSASLPKQAGLALHAARPSALPRASLPPPGRNAVETESIPSPPTCPAPEGQRHLVRGRALDVEGRPVSGLSVCRIAPFITSPDEPVTRRGAPTDDCAISDGEGHFTMKVPMLGWFAASSPSSAGWTTVLSEELPFLEDGEPLLVVARSQRLAGQVVDEQGHGLGGVEVALSIAPRRLLALGEVLNTAAPIPHQLKTDVEGAFAFEDAPREDLVVEAWKEGFERRIVELRVEQELEPLRLTLQQSSLPTVTGIVVDPSGRPVEGAFVSAGQRIASSDASGSFLITFDPKHWHDRPSDQAQSIIVRAVREGLGMAEREIDLPPAGSPPVSVHLVLEEEAQTIEGRVLDLRGAPVGSVEVFILEDTPFGWVPADGLGGWIYRRSLEFMLGARPAWTSADGSFAISGLIGRSYRLQVLQPTRLLCTVSDPIPSGSRGVRLSLDLEACGMVAGRIVDGEGMPVERVRVSASCRQWWEGPTDTDSSLAIGPAAETDSQGRFALKDVAREGVFLRLEGESIVPEIFRTIDSDADPTALELVVARRAYLQLHWGDWSERAERLHLEAEDGSRLGFADLGGLGVAPLDWIAVGTGLSSAFTIPVGAAHAVLTRDETEVIRVPLHPVPGKLELVHL